MNLLDKTINWMSPSWGAERAQARARSAAIARLSNYPQSSSSRLSGDVTVRGASADWTLEAKLDRRAQVDKARELERTNVLAEGLLSRSTESVIGDGFKLQMDSGDDGLDDEIEAQWKDWADNDADYRAMATWDEMLATIYRSKMRDGDVAAVMMAEGSVRLVESDEIASPSGGYLRKDMVDGVELDKRGRPIAFHVLSYDGDDYPDRRAALQRLVRIPSENVVFAARRLRAGQTRGITALSNLFWILEQVLDSVEAVTVAMRMAACFGLIIKQHGPLALDLTQADSAGKTRQSLKLEPGMWKRLEPGEEIEQIQPTHPGANFNDHVQGLIRLGGIPFGLPLEVILRDFTKSNFSNTRAALLQAWHTWQRQQNEMKRICTKIFMWRLLNWYPGLSPEQCKHSWQAPGWAWIDPVAEVQSSMLAVDAGYSSPQREIARLGGDWKEIQAENEEWRKDREAKNLPLLQSNLSREAAPSIEDQIKLAQAKPAPAPGAPGKPDAEKKKPPA